MAWIATREFPADGIDFEPGDVVPDEVMRGFARHFLPAQGYVAFVPDDALPINEPPEATTAAEREASQEGVNVFEAEPTGERFEEPIVTTDDVREEARQQEEHERRVEEDLEAARNGEIDATGRAIELAEQHSIKLSLVEGTGEEGRITADDVRKYVAKREEE